MGTVILAIFIVGTIVFALINFRKAKTATPANRAMKYNDAKISLSCSALFAGCLLLTMATTPFSVAAFDWIIDPLLVVAAFALMVGGIVMLVICMTCMGSIKQQILCEANPWTSRQ